MPLAPGTRLGHYTIVSFIGAGGMGEVYQAEDTVLRRQVAIKTLPERLVADRAALARFETEARALAALSHPNILLIHEFGRSDDIAYAVEELLEGETLRDSLMRSGMLPWRKACDVSAAIADGLAAAHAKGVIHRDLKPENVFVTSDGRIKILDFGLARLTASSADTDSGTAQLTAPGTVMGTLHYMAPEQLRGEKVDQTADIFSFGCMLFEMIAAKRPFARPSEAATISAILSDDVPDLSSIASSVPPELLRIIQHCLEKNPRDRFQSARDVAISLRALASPVTSGGQRQRATVSRWPWYAAAGVLLLLAGVTIVVLVRRRSPTRPERIASVAVLPFENAAHDPDTEYLSDGLTEGLINSLSKLPDMRVLARTTSFAYKKSTLDPQKIGRDLGVEAVVTGKLTSHGDALSVQAELVDVNTVSQLWGEQYEEHSRDLVSIQQTIAAQLSRQLRPELTIQQEQRFSAEGTQNPEAYALFLKGRFEFAKRNAEAMQRAEEFFRSAIAIDPRFALAYSALADARLVSRDFGVPDTEQEAEPAIARALELSPQSAEAHASSGLAKMAQWSWPEAQREFRTAIALNPNYASAHQWLAGSLEATGQADEALLELRRAETVDPLAPIIFTNKSRMLAAAGRFDEAVTAAKRSLELNPNFGWGYLNLALAYDALHRYDEAAAAFEKLKQLSGYGQWCEAGLAIVYAHSGRRAEAEALVQPLSLQSAAVVPRVEMAMVWNALGQRDQALRSLNIAVEERDAMLVFWISSPVLRDLRSDARFQEILRRIAAGGQAAAPLQPAVAAHRPLQPAR